MASQIGHTDPTFTLKTYTAAVKRRQRMTPAELEQFNAAVEWAEWAATGSNAVVVPAVTEVESVA